MRTLVTTTLIAVLGVPGIPTVASQADDRQNGKQARAVPKTAYDAIERTQESVSYLRSLGVSIHDLEPLNLPFPSTDFLDCEAQVDAFAESRHEAAILRITCFKLHRASLESRYTDNE